MHEFTDFTRSQLQTLAAAGKKLNYDVFALYNHDYNDVDLKDFNVYLFNTQVVTSHKFQKRYYYDCSLLDFYGNNIEFSFLSFYEDHPDYDYYWLVEYDVIFNGDFSEFFRYFESYDYDFITSYIKETDDCWTHKHLIWCRTFTPSKQYQNLNALDRFSNKALYTLLK